jgi:hypothetical protein
MSSERLSENVGKTGTSSTIDTTDFKYSLVNKNFLYCE